MEYLKNYPDDHFDLAIVDPPYGDGGVLGRDKIADSEDCLTRTGGAWAKKYGKKS